MSAGKPRGPVPSLIGGSNGRPKRIAVDGTSKCFRCDHIILAGQKCIEIPKLGTAYRNPKRYCDDCYGKILKKTTEDIEEISKL